jgi:hypothetical protein
VFTTIFKRIKAMISPEPKLVAEEAVAQCMNWDLPEVQLRCQALGIDAEVQKQLYIELFRTVTAEKWAEAERRIAYIRSRAFDGTPAAIAVELARGFVPPPVKSVKDLERAARAWAAAFQHPGSFLATIWNDVLAHEPQPGPGRQWLQGGLQSIACGLQTSLGPRPAAPPAVSPEAFHVATDAASRAQVIHNRAMAQRGREWCEPSDAPEPVAGK